MDPHHVPLGPSGAPPGEGDLESNPPRRALHGRHHRHSANAVEFVSGPSIPFREGEANLAAVLRRCSPKCRKRRIGTSTGSRERTRRSIEHVRHVDSGIYRRVDDKSRLAGKELGAFSLVFVNTIPFSFSLK